jgi:DNA polymerase III alpha subunit
MENTELHNYIQQAKNNLNFDFPYDIDEWIDKGMPMENYHSHTYYSNIMTMDSPSSPEDYAKRVIELGGKCLFGMEHGSQGNMFLCYELAKQYNLKYVHGTEAYWVKNRHEKDKTNCHIVIQGKNDKARKKINYILSLANEDGYYYKPRIDLELIDMLPKDDVVITSACVA